MSSYFYSSYRLSIISFFCFYIFSLYSNQKSSFSFFSISFRNIICCYKTLSLLFFSSRSFYITRKSSYFSCWYLIFSLFSRNSYQVLTFFLIFFMFSSSLQFFSRYLYICSWNLAAIQERSATAFPFRWVVCSFFSATENYSFFSSKFLSLSSLTSFYSAYKSSLL